MDLHPVLTRKMGTELRTRQFLPLWDRCARISPCRKGMKSVPLPEPSSLTKNNEFKYLEENHPTLSWLGPIADGVVKLNHCAPRERAANTVTQHLHWYQPGSLTSKGKGGNSLPETLSLRKDQRETPGPRQGRSNEEASPSRQAHSA